MKLFTRLLALVCVLAFVRASLMVGGWGSQFRKIYLDFGVTPPGATGLLISMPFWAYLAFGLTLGALVAWLICVVRPPSVSIVLAVGVLVGLLLCMRVISDTLYSPVAPIVRERAASETPVMGEPADAMDSR